MGSYSAGAKGVEVGLVEAQDVHRSHAEGSEEIRPSRRVSDLAWARVRGKTPKRRNGARVLVDSRAVEGLSLQCTLKGES